MDKETALGIRNALVTIAAKLDTIADVLIDVRDCSLTEISCDLEHVASAIGSVELNS